MKHPVKSFLHRGLAFGGFGPIVMGIVYLILSFTIDGFSASGKDIFLAIISTYLLAFVHAGVSIFNQMEHWPIAKSTLFHFGALYLAYTACYLMNAWIPFDWRILAIYTGIFVGVYLVIWLTVILILHAVKKNMNKRLQH